MCSGSVRILATSSHRHGRGTTACGSGFFPRSLRTPRIAWSTAFRRPFEGGAGASSRRSDRIRASMLARSSSGILDCPSRARRRRRMPMPQLKILGRGFESLDLALQAGDCLIQPRFCAFEIERALVVLGFRRGSWHSIHRSCDGAVPGPIRNSPDIRNGDYRARGLQILWLANPCDSLPISSGEPVILRIAGLADPASN